MYRSNSILYFEVDEKAVVVLALTLRPERGIETITSEFLDASPFQTLTGAGREVAAAVERARELTMTDASRRMLLGRLDPDALARELDLADIDALLASSRLEISIGEDSDGDWFVSAQCYESGGVPADAKDFYMGPKGDPIRLEEAFREARAWAKTVTDKH